MSPEWETIPLLPLTCILDHLSLEDALTAMSVSRHWRSAVLLYEGHRETLTLRAKHLDRCLFLTRLFKKHTKKLHIYLDSNQEELDKFMSYVLPQFYRRFKMPALGCIDGTHVAIVCPLDNEERFFNRKGYHSLNVQILCDSNLNILSVDASYPGSTHDSVIWANHPLNGYLERLHNVSGEDVYLLGDSGYPLRPIMMTPVSDPAPDTPDEYYQNLHLTARSVVERCIGVLKARFRFCDTVKLQEIIFIGPRYSEQNPHLPVVKLKRVITEALIYKHSHCLKKLALLGCDMGVVKNENDRFIHKNVEYYSRALSFPEGGAADAIISRANTSLMEFSTLQHLLVDYEQINTESLETLSQLAAFSRLTLNVNYNSAVAYNPIDWDRLDACYPNALDVSVNLIGVPMDKMDEIIYIVLREGMLLTSLKVLYCKTLYQPVLEHLVRLYKETLRELVWADGPEDSTDNRFVHPDEDASQFGLCNVNPFILLCWQCTQLRRLVIHGYWVWQYDLLGFVRLCKSLCHVEVPALYRRQGRFRSCDRAVRVLATDQPMHADDQFIQEMNEYTEFQWKPTPWSKLHLGLQARASPHQRSAYLLQEALQPLGVT